MRISLALINSIGFQVDNYAPLAAYCAYILRAALTSSPAIQLAPAIPAKPARAAVIAQTAKPARAATAAVSASANTVGYGFGELYLNSPAYPVGIAIPAIPVKPASAEVVGSPGEPAVPAQSAVIAPEVKAIPGFADAITITNETDSVLIEAYIPTVNNLELIGVIPSSKPTLMEITPPTLEPKIWVGNKASQIPGNFTAAYMFPVVEQLLLECARRCINSGFDSTIEDTVRQFGAGLLRCKKITIRIGASMAKGYSPVDDTLHLEAFDYFINPNGGNGGNGTQPLISPA